MSKVDEESVKKAFIDSDNNLNDAFDASELKAIYLGNRISIEAKHEITEILDEEQYKHVLIYQMTSNEESVCFERIR